MRYGTMDTCTAPVRRGGLIRLASSRARRRICSCRETSACEDTLTRGGDGEQLICFAPRTHELKSHWEPVRWNGQRDRWMPGDVEELREPQHRGTHGERLAVVER